MKSRTAYVFWNAGVCSVIEAWTQRVISRSPSGDLKGAIYRARKKGYDVKVYTDVRAPGTLYKRLTRKRR